MAVPKTKSRIKGKSGGKMTPKATYILLTVPSTEI